MLFMISYIDEDDLLRFMIKEEVDLVFPLLFEGSSTGKIDNKSFTNWVVRALYETPINLEHFKIFYYILEGGFLVNRKY